MRSKKLALNTFFSLLEELVAIICGFILPRLILSAFGSKYNGITTSITQFLSCAVLLRAGIGGVTRAALYKPLANHDKNKIDSIVKATDMFMRKIGIILAIAIIVFSLIYPLFVIDEFDYLFSSSLFLIIGISTFAESFFGITYLVVLQADQKVWVSSLIRSICYIVNTLLAVILVFCGFGIHIVKLGSSLVFVLYPVVMQIYVKKKYKLDTNVQPDNKAISQRWDAFWQQVAMFVMTNTDIIILTTFSSMANVSVYSVYALIINGIRKGIKAFTNALEAPFGNMIAKNEKKALYENLSIIELIMYSMSTIIYTVAIIIILQFVSVYTKGISDANYLVPLFAYILLVAQFFDSIRNPYQLVVQAAGHYKQTKVGSIIEPIINITLSTVFVLKYGLVGVAIGTLVATVFRTIQYSFYMCKNIVKRNQLITIFKIFVSIVESLTIILVINILKLDFTSNFMQLIINFIIVTIISCFVVLLSNYFIFRKDYKNTIKKMKNIFKRKKKSVEGIKI